MRISRREQILVGTLTLVAAVVLFMHSQESSSEKAAESGSSVSAARVLTQFRQVRPLPAFSGSGERTAPDNDRNIFRYGEQRTEASVTVETDQVTPDIKEIQAAREAAEQAAAERVGLPVPPAIDFTVLGIIETTTGRAAVISRTPELFVVRETSRFLEKFILKEVTRDGITIGYIGFEETTFLPLETGRGF